MFTIIYQNKYNKQFCTDFYFEKSEDLKEHLISQGYVENKRIFIRGKSTAYVQPLKSFIK